MHYLCLYLCSYPSLTSALTPIRRSIVYDDTLPSYYLRRPLPKLRPCTGLRGAAYKLKPRPSSSASFVCTSPDTIPVISEGSDPCVHLHAMKARPAGKLAMDGEHSKVVTVGQHLDQSPIKALLSYLDSLLLLVCLSEVTCLIATLYYA